MELVYLWVEEYKNIKKQGFNFSPKFDCKFHDEYDSDGKLKDKCKLEINPREHISIFPDNINITAIVGANGSGKSSILDILHTFFSEWLYHKTFMVFYQNEKFYIHSHKYILTNENNLGEIIYLANDKIHNLFRNIHEVYYKNENNHTFLSNKDSQEFNLDSKNSSHIIKHIVNVFMNLDKKKIPDVMFNPKYIKISIEYDRLLEDLDEYNSSIRNDIEQKITLLENNTSDQDNFLKQIFEILDLKSNINNIGDIKHEKDFMNLISQTDLNKKFRLSKKYKYREELKYCVNNLNFPLSQHRDFNHFTTLEVDKIDKEMFDFLYLLPPIAFNLKLFDKKNINFDSLSFGEKNLITLLSTFFSLSEQMTYEEEGIEIIDTGDIDIGEIEKDITYDEIINQNFFLIDEYELGLHPQWHKEMLSNMISFFNKLNKNIHLIVTTHSPFIISDLPKENVIFLKDGKQEYPFKNQQTFGANIHTLLSDGFFMSDGLMGEFAKNKIQNVINFINEKESDLKKEEIFPIIELIGEPFLKQKLKEQYFNKYPEERNIDNEISLLEEKLAKLKNDKNTK